MRFRRHDAAVSVRNDFNQRPSQPEAARASTKHDVGLDIHTRFVDRVEQWKVQLYIV